MGFLAYKVKKIVKRPIEAIFVFFFPVEILFLIGEIFGGNVEGITSAFLYKSKGILDGMFPGIIFIVFVIYLCLILPVDIIEEKRKNKQLYSFSGFISYFFIYIFLLISGLFFMFTFGKSFYGIRIPEFNTGFLFYCAVMYFFFFSFGFMMSMIFSRKNSLLIVSVSYFLPEIFLNNSVIPSHILSVEAQKYSEYLLTSRLIKIFKCYYNGKQFFFNFDDLIGILLPMAVFFLIAVLAMLIRKRKPEEV